jgi:20S proteasome alpha/beta subunit
LHLACTVTVVLALRCDDGIVIGADTQITESARGMSYPARKLHLLGEHAAWGGSGARAVLTDTKAAFDESAAAILESTDVGRAMQELMLPILKHHYDTFIEHVPGEDTAGTPATYLLAAGYADDTPWIVEINPNAMVGRYEDIGFHAIGSGAAMAQQAGALLAHFRMIDRPVRYGVAGVLRVLEALSYTSPSVGGPFDIVRITPEGVDHLDDDELDETRADIERWAELEQKALDDLYG